MQWRCSVIQRLHRKVQNTHTWQDAPHRWHANDSAPNVSKGWSWTIYLWPGFKGYNIYHNVVQPIVIVRAVVNKFARGSRISRNNRQALKEFSLDIINCLAIMHGLHYCADVNAIEHVNANRTFGDQSTMTRTISSLTIWSSCGETYSEMFKVWRLSSSRDVYSLSVSGLSQLRVFAHASGSACDRVAYLLRSTTEGPSVRLVSAKVRVPLFDSLSSTAWTNGSAYRFQTRENDLPRVQD